MAILNTQTVTGTLAALNANVALGNVTSGNDSMGTHRIRVSGPYTGTLTVTGSVDGTNFSTIALPVANASGVISATIPANATGDFTVLNSAGFKAIRVTMTSYTSGTATVIILGSHGIIAPMQIVNPSDLIQTTTATAGTAATLTLPAGGAGLFHYINSLVIQRFAAALLTAAATPTIITTTNLAGSLAFSIPVEAAAQGSVYQEKLIGASPIKSAAANTATTIVAPATTSVIWRITAYYSLYI